MRQRKSGRESEWYVFTDEESGPHTFQQLAERLARGDLMDTDLVRHQDLPEWQRVDQRPDLLQAANVLRHRNESSGRESLSGLPRRFLSSRRGLAGLTLLMILLVIGWSWNPFRSRHGPPVRGAAEIEWGRRSRLEQSPATASDPSESVSDQRTIVPGFEPVSWVKSPTLSADMLTIVYVADAGKTQQEDLFIAERASVSDPFTHHRPVVHANSEQREVQPTLSPDGLELIFVRRGKSSTLWYSRRNSRSQMFANARPLVLMDDPAPGSHQTAPQFIDDRTIQFTVTQPGSRHQSRWFASRLDAERFQMTEPVPETGFRSTFFINHDRTRAYCQTQAGVMVEFYNPTTRVFDSPVTLIPTDRLTVKESDADDSIWVSPDEDVVYFSAPELGADHQSGRRLWKMPLTMGLKHSMP
ncbi:DUF4339 domain-containing protein [Planctomicrobium sp. SH661]|uniref:DUF4339 domain-containing protein n=1 Tax=Planctomicrobium sp. SH661 TaxID=3448124 RepID=UPI003F5AE5EE